LRNVEDIAVQAGNTPEQNARLFAMSSVAMADAAIAAWDGKFEHDFWRPVTAIENGDDDGNDLTEGDPDWRPLGAPGDPTVADSDFTPPFPAWPSGHASMGGALFETLKLFFGTNVFDEIDGIIGNNAYYELHSDEMMLSDTLVDVTDSRQFTTFSSLLDTDDPDYGSPEWENAVSRIYLGIHWIFDATDGIALGNMIARDVHASRFQAVPEPGTWGLALTGATLAGLWIGRRRRT
jgi:hypothetical protein